MTSMSSSCAIHLVIAHSMCVCMSVPPLCLWFVWAHPEHRQMLYGNLVSNAMRDHAPKSDAIGAKKNFKGVARLFCVSASLWVCVCVCVEWQFQMFISLPRTRTHTHTYLTCPAGVCVCVSHSYDAWLIVSDLKLGRRQHTKIRELQLKAQTLITLTCTHTQTRTHTPLPTSIRYVCVRVWLLPSICGCSLKTWKHFKNLIIAISQKMKKKNSSFYRKIFEN